MTRFSKIEKTKPPRSVWLDQMIQFGELYDFFCKALDGVLRIATRGPAQYYAFESLDEQDLPCGSVREPDLRLESGCAGA